MGSKAQKVGGAEADRVLAHEAVSGRIPLHAGRKPRLCGTLPQRYGRRERAVGALPDVREGQAVPIPIYIELGRDA